MIVWQKFSVLNLYLWQFYFVFNSCLISKRKVESLQIYFNISGYLHSHLYDLLVLYYGPLLAELHFVRQSSIISTLAKKSSISITFSNSFLLRITCT